MGCRHRYEASRDPINQRKPRWKTTLPSSTNVLDYRINTLNGKFFYYTADQFAVDREEVFAVPINGSGNQITRISPSVASNSDSSFVNSRGNVIAYRFRSRGPRPSIVTLRGVSQSVNSSFLISEQIALLDFFTILESNSGNFLTFLTRESGSTFRRLFSLFLAPNSTNNRVLISQDSSNTMSSYIRSISSDDEVVVYAADNPNTPDTQNLFATSLEKGQPARITPNLPSGTEITDAKISSNALHVVYRADQSTVGRFNIYSTTLTINETEPEDDALCLPIVTRSGNTAVICL